MGALEITIYFLALWRVAHMIIYERGFLDIFLRIREIFGILHDDAGIPTINPETNAGRLFSCMWCMSTFLAIPYTILILIDKNISNWLSLPFAISALAIAFNRLLGREEVYYG